MSSINLLISSLYNSNTLTLPVDKLIIEIPVINLSLILSIYTDKIKLSFNKFLSESIYVPIE